VTSSWSLILQLSMKLYLVISNAFPISGQWKKGLKRWHIQCYQIRHPCRIMSLKPTATSNSEQAGLSQGVSKRRHQFTTVISYNWRRQLLPMNLVSLNNATFVLKIQVFCSAMPYHWVHNCRRFYRTYCLAVQNRAGQRAVFVPKFSAYFASPPQSWFRPLWRSMRC